MLLTTVNMAATELYVKYLKYPYSLGLANRRRNMMIGDAKVRSDMPLEDPDRVVANGGYNQMKTAKDLLKHDFDDKGDVTDTDHSSVAEVFFAGFGISIYINIVFVKS